MDLFAEFPHHHRLVEEEYNDGFVPGTDSQVIRDTFRVYGSAFLVMLVSFCLLRIRYPKLFNVRSWSSQIGCELARQQHYGLISWIWRVFLVPEDDIMNNCGMDALCFLRVIRFGFRVSCVGMFNSIWLIPMYKTAEATSIQDPLEETTASNVPPESRRFVGTVIGAYVVFLFTMHLILKEFEWFTKKRHQFLCQRTPRNYAVYVTGIPEEYRSSQLLLSYFRSCFSREGVVEAHVAMDIPSLEKLVANRDVVAEKLEHAMAIARLRGYSPKHLSLKDLTQVDSIEVYKQHLNKLNEEIRSAKRKVQEISMRNFEVMQALAKSKAPAEEQISPPPSPTRRRFVSDGFKLFPIRSNSTDDGDGPDFHGSPNSSPSRYPHFGGSPSSESSHVRLAQKEASYLADLDFGDERGEFKEDDIGLGTQEMVLLETPDIENGLQGYSSLLPLKEHNITDSRVRHEALLQWEEARALTDRVSRPLPEESEVTCSSSDSAQIHFSSDIVNEPHLDAASVTQSSMTSSFPHRKLFAWPLWPQSKERSDDDSSDVEGHESQSENIPPTGYTMDVDGRESLENWNEARILSGKKRSSSKNRVSLSTESDAERMAIEEWTEAQALSGKRTVPIASKQYSSDDTKKSEQWKVTVSLSSPTSAELSSDGRKVGPKSCSLPNEPLKTEERILEYGENDVPQEEWSHGEASGEGVVHDSGDRAEHNLPSSAHSENENGSQSNLDSSLPGSFTEKSASSKGWGKFRGSILRGQNVAKAVVIKSSDKLVQVVTGTTTDEVVKNVGGVVREVNVENIKKATEKGVGGIKNVAKEGVKQGVKSIRQATDMGTGAILDVATTAKSIFLGGEDGKPRDAGFVVFSKLSTTNAALQMIHSSTPYIMDVEEAPDPDDIFWSNVGMSHRSRMVGQLLSFGLSAVLCFFWTVPVSFISSLAQVESLRKAIPGLDKAIENHPWLGQALSILAPLMLIGLNAVLPQILRQFARVEGHIASSVLEASLFVKMSAFMIIQTFFVSAISGGVYNQLAAILEDPASLIDLLATSLPLQGTYFTQILLVSTFLGLGLELLRVYPLGTAFVRGRIGPNLTEKERNKTLHHFVRPLSDPFEFQHAEVFANVILYFMVIFVYAVISPIINFFMAFCFMLMASAYRYQFIHNYSATPDSGGKLWLSFIGISLTCMLIAQATLIGLLALKKAKYATPCMVPLMILTIGFNLFLRGKHFYVTKHLPSRECLHLDRKNYARGLGTSFLHNRYIQSSLLVRDVVPEEMYE